MGIPDSSTADDAPWSDVDVSRWAGTKRSLHLYAQMLGKIKLAVAPIRPNWLFTALHLSPRGLTTGTVPWRGSSFEATIDVSESTIALVRSDGSRASIPLLPARTVAEVYADLTAALAELGIGCTISTTPQEIPDTTPLDADRRPSEYDPTAVRRWFASATAASGLFDEWRADFSGRTALQVWWGAFDVALLLFSGRRLAPPLNRGYLMRYDLDAELMNAGLYYGDEQTAPYFYGYIYPEPKGADGLPIAPAQAAWSKTIHEWTLPYDAVRKSANPSALIHSFLDAIYENCVTAAGWQRAMFAYERPPVASR